MITGTGNGLGPIGHGFWPRFALGTGVCAAPAQNLKDTIYLDTKDGRIMILLRPDLAPKHVAQIEALTSAASTTGSSSIA